MALACLTACAPPILELPSGSRFVLATRTPEGATARWWTPDERLVEVPDDATIAVAGPFPDRVSLWPSWERVDPIAAGATPSIGSPAPSGSCERCQLSRLDAAAPGDRCRVPPDAERRGYQLDGHTLVVSEEAAKLADELVIDWPGACSVDPLPAPPGAMFSRILGPERDVTPLSGVALGEDGAAALSTLDEILVVEPSGALLRRSLPGWNQHPLAIPGSRPSRFLVGDTNQELYEISAALPTPTRRVPRLLEPRIASLPGGALALTGDRTTAAGLAATLMICDPSSWSCVDERFPSACPPRRITWLAPEGDELWALGMSSRLVIRPPSGAWRCGAELVEGGFPAEFAAPSSLRVDASTFVLCAHDDATSIVYAVGLSPDGARATLLDQVTLDHVVECTSTLREDGGTRILLNPSRVGLALRDGQLFVVPTTRAGLDRTVERVRATATATVYVTADGAVFRELGAGPTQLFGNERPPQERSYAVAANTDGFWVIAEDGATTRLDVAGEELAKSRVGGLRPGESVRRAAFDDRARWLITSFDAEHWLVSLDERLEVTGGRRLALSAIDRIEPASPGWAFALANGGLYAVSLDADPIPLGTSTGLRALSAVGGVAWATGVEDVVRATISAGAPFVDQLTLDSVFTVPPESLRMRDGPLVGLSIHARAPGEARLMVYERSIGAADDVNTASHLTLWSDELDGWEVEQKYVSSGLRARLFQRFAATEVLTIAGNGSTWHAASSAAGLLIEHDQYAVLPGEPWSSMIVSGRHGRLAIVRASERR